MNLVTHGEPLKCENACLLTRILPLVWPPHACKQTICLRVMSTVTHGEPAKFENAWQASSIFSSQNGVCVAKNVSICNDQCLAKCPSGCTCGVSQMLTYAVFSGTTEMMNVKICVIVFASLLCKLIEHFTCSDHID